MSSLIPEEELHRSSSLNLAPLVDFLFVVLAVFVTLAVTRAALFDSDVNLVKIRAHDKESAAISQNNFYTINLSVTQDGKYKWITEGSEFLMENIPAIRQELLRQQELGLLPKEKDQTKVLLHIDQDAKWAPIADLIYTIRETGFTIHPVYERP